MVAAVLEVLTLLQQNIKVILADSESPEFFIYLSILLYAKETYKCSCWDNNVLFCPKGPRYSLLPILQFPTKP